MNNTNNTLTELELASFIVNEAIRGPILLTQVALLVLVVVFRNHQPLKARSIFPAAFMICKIIEQSYLFSAAVPSQYFTNAYVGKQVLCFFQVWVSEPIIITIMMVLGLNFTRFIVLGMLTRRKERKASENMDKFSMDTTTDDELPSQDAGEITARRLQKADAESNLEKKVYVGPDTKSVKLLQFLLTKKSYILWIAIVQFILLIVGILQLTVNNGVCIDGIVGFNHVLQLIVILALYFVLMALSIGDFIYNGIIGGTCRCSKSWFDKFFFEDDPLVFRLELALSLFFSTAQILVEVAFITLMVLSVKGKPDYVPIAGLIHAIGHSLTTHLAGLVASPGIALSLAIVWYSRLKKRDKAAVRDGTMDLAIYNRSEETITQILASSDKKIAALFKQFTMKEFSVENVLLYYDIAKFKSMSEKNKLKFINYIYTTYLDEKSSLQVNLPRDTLDDLKKKIKGVGESKLIPENLWEDLMVELNQNLLDTYARFYDSKEFKSYLLSSADV